MCYRQIWTYKTDIDEILGLPLHVWNKRNQWKYYRAYSGRGRDVGSLTKSVMAGHTSWGICLNCSFLCSCTSWRSHSVEPDLLASIGQCSVRSPMLRLSPFPWSQLQQDHHQQEAWTWSVFGDLQLAHQPKAAILGKWVSQRNRMYISCLLSPYWVCSNAVYGLVPWSDDHTFILTLYQISGWLIG